MGKIRGLLVAIALVASIGGGTLLWAYYAADLAAAKARIARGSSLVETRSGRMEYASAGDGVPLLMIHGTGGGVDQGLDFAKPLIPLGYRIIAPSRFGYLRSAFPADTSSEAQADAFVDLLDKLNIDRVPVIGGSAGALSAMQFAIRHPERCSALVVLVPATYDPNRALENVELGPIAQAIIAYALRSDFLYWLGVKLAPAQMIKTLLATDPVLVERADPAERERVQRILWTILPVSKRANGFMNDARLAGAPKPMALSQIRVPTLAISLEDDHFGTLAPARHIAASVPNARLVTFATGGHVWVGQDAEIFREVDLFLRRSGMGG